MSLLFLEAPKFYNDKITTLSELSSSSTDIAGEYLIEIYLENIKAKVVNSDRTCLYFL